MQLYSIPGIDGSSATIDLHAFAYAQFSPTLADRPHGPGRLTVAVSRATGVVEELSLMVDRGLELANLAAHLRATANEIARMGDTLISNGEIAAIKSRTLPNDRGWHHQVTLHVDRYDGLTMRNEKVVLATMDTRPLSEILPHATLGQPAARTMDIEAQLALL